MRVGTRGLALLKRYETLVLEAYQGEADKRGVLTIGWGHTGDDVKLGATITPEQADELLEVDLATAEKGVAHAVGFAFGDEDATHVLEFASTTQAQFDAMVSLAYNIGVGAFGNSTVLRSHMTMDYFGAANAFGMWRKSAGKDRRGLMRRRMEEAALYCDDRFPD